MILNGFPRECDGSTPINGEGGNLAAHVEKARQAHTRTAATREAPRGWRKLALRCCFGMRCAPADLTTPLPSCKLLHPDLTHLDSATRRHAHICNACPTWTREVKAGAHWCMRCGDEQKLASWEVVMVATGGGCLTKEGSHTPRLGLRLCAVTHSVSRSPCRLFLVAERQYLQRRLLGLLGPAHAVRIQTSGPLSIQASGSGMSQQIYAQRAETVALLGTSLGSRLQRNSDKRTSARHGQRKK